MKEANTCGRGTPFIDQNEYEGLTLWEQIDRGDQFTPSRKYFTGLPILLYLHCAANERQVPD